MRGIAGVTGEARAARALSGRLAGRIVVPGDTDWDLARQPWNLAARSQPTAVALPESAEDARVIVEFVRAHRLRIAPRGTGHGALSLGSLDDTILLNTARMRSVQIDIPARFARVQAGALWGEVAAAAAGHGLAGLAGSSPTVGVVGYSAGGGLGWLARRYGLAANSIRAADVVTADGRLIRADGEHNPDLFWAIRGGGGSFGIITALEFALYPVRQVYGGALFWPPERAGEILRAWRAWTDGLPEEVTSIARLRRMPSRPGIPPQLRGRSFVIIEAACIAAAADAIRLLRPLRALGPDTDTFAVRPMTDLGPLHLDPEQPMPRIGDGRLLTDLPAAAIDALCATGMPEPGSPIASVEVRHLGGALARRPATAGALACLDARFAVYAVGMAATADLAPPVEHGIDLLLDMLAPWDAGRRYPNFAERHVDASDFYPAETIGRLRRIKAAHDPGDLIRSNHPIKPQP
ncbi:MAG TPA: FAD-binding oxidoreductase [Streptosporangiaceae bacterium]|nr:FAD-binding oxidoreductase [Streptosporangiaceae bacterium]